METAMKSIKTTHHAVRHLRQDRQRPRARYGDGRGGLGLSVLVRPGSRSHLAKRWTQSVRISGKPTSLGLGRYPGVTLALARQRALENA